MYLCLYLFLFTVVAACGFILFFCLFYFISMSSLNLLFHFISFSCCAPCSGSMIKGSKRKNWFTIPYYSHSLSVSLSLSLCGSLSRSPYLFLSISLFFSFYLSISLSIFISLTFCFFFFLIPLSHTYQNSSIKESMLRSFGTIRIYNRNKCVRAYDNVF